MGLLTPKFKIALIGLRLYQLGGSNLVPHHISSNENIISDFILRAFKTGIYFHRTTIGLIAYFNTNSPLQN